MDVRVSASVLEMAKHTDWETPSEQFWLEVMEQNPFSETGLFHHTSLVLKTRLAWTVQLFLHKGLCMLSNFTLVKTLLG